MFRFRARDEIIRLFRDIYNILVNTDRNLDKPWYKIDKINFFKNYSSQQIEAIIMKFGFLSKQSWNHVEIDKIEFILESLKFLNRDIAELSLILDYNGFEKLVKSILNFSEYSVLNNYRFSDKSDFIKSTSQSRYEIDVIGLKLNILLLIDAKQWNRRDSFSAINKAANLQLRRAQALKKNPLILGDLIKELSNSSMNKKKFLPLHLIPLMVTLEESNIKLSEKNVPLVSIYKLNSFLKELSNNLYYFNTIKIDKINIQKSLY